MEVEMSDKPKQPTLERQRRVRRGVVAGYLHEISARHRHVEIRIASPDRLRSAPPLAARARA